MLLHAEKIHKIYNGIPLFENIDLQIEDRDRIGLIGANGCGKSTLLKILIGEIEADRHTEEEGILSFGSKTTIGYMAQSAALDSEKSVWQEMRSVYKDVIEAQERMRVIEREMAQNDESLHEEYDHLTALVEARDGYQIDVKIRTVLQGMGFSQDTHQRIVSGFSGGEKTRLALARLLLESPNLLILDEPTNHLDFDTIAWLEEYLQGYKGALLIVSHDRYFLDRLCTSICEIERRRLTRYRGNYSAYTVQKAAAVERQLKEYTLQQKEIAKIEDFVARNIVRASTSKMAKSRQKQLDRMELIEKPILEQKRAGLSFTYEVEPPTEILEVDGVDISVGEGLARKRLVESLCFQIRRGDRVGIIGPNGVGKSTLLKELLGDLPHEGRVRWNKNIRLAYFDQESANLNPLHTVIDELHDRFPAMLDGEIRSILGQVRIIGEDVFKPISALSGGERARVCFALLMLEHGNVMLLDEPTNHIDLPMKEVLEDALIAYTGTLVFVSHDRYFLNRLATSLLELTTDGAILHPYGFAEYLEKMQNSKQGSEDLQHTEQSTREKKTVIKNAREKRSVNAARRNRYKTLEQEIEELERRADELEQSLTDPGLCADYQKMQSVCEELEATKEKIEENFFELMELEEELS